MELTYRVVVNHEQQYSIWRADLALPPGWTAAGPAGSRTACLAHIEQMDHPVSGSPPQATALCSSESRRSDPLAVRPATEHERLIAAWNATDRPYPRERCLHTLFEAQVAQRGDAPAIVHGHDAMSYAQLEARANQLAHHLVAAGVTAGSRVAVRLPRSIALVTAELAILKCGAAYVPLDEHAPEERQAFMIADCGATIVLTSTGQDAPPAAATRIDLDTLATSDHSTERPEVAMTSDAAAYVMYTSGSTGQPKGCEIAHRSVGRLVLNCGYARFAPSDRVAFVANPAFDASIMEVWAPLLTGGCVVVIDSDVVTDPERLTAALEAGAVSILSLTAGLFHRSAAAMTAAFARPRYLFVGGDTVDATVVARVLRDGAPRHFIHAYGPTETTLFATTYEVREVAPGATSLPIGRPISNTRAYILDPAGQPTPIGVAGELHIGGEGVARGYVNRPALTAERFVPDPLGGVSGARMYRTGDIARYRADGEIEFLGRNDHQVKLRGFRVELGEIEARLRGHPGIADAIVVACADGAGDKRLVAYYAVMDESPALRMEDLTAHLATSLPAFMIPAAYVRLAALPMTPNGKVDRTALPAPQPADVPRTARAYEPPATGTEQRLARLWAELLHLDRVGRHDNFFELGGHSLLALALIDRMQREHMHAKTSAVFTSPTLTGLAVAVDAADLDVVVPARRIPEAGVERLVPTLLPLISLDQDELDRIVGQVPGGARNIEDIYPLSPLQEGILFHHLVAERGDPYVLSAPLRFASRDRLDAYLDALRAVIARHEILRTSVHWEGLAEPVQVVWRHAPLLVEDVAVHEGDVLAQLRAAFDPRQRRLDVRQAPLLRVVVARDPAHDQWFAVQLIHHLASDHTSADAIRDEIQAHLAGETARLAAPVGMRDFVARARLGEARPMHERYFTQLLGDVTEVTAAYGFVNAREEGVGVTEHICDLDPALLARLRDRARALGVTTASLCHVAWALLLSRAAGTDDVVFGSVLFGRMQGGVGANRALGLLINALPVRARLARVTAETAVRQMHDQLGALLHHEHASLALAQRCSGIRAPAPLFTALLNYHHSTPLVEASAPRHPAWQGIEILPEEERTNFPLMLAIEDSGRALRLKAQARSPLDPRHVCATVVAALDELAAALESSPPRALASLLDGPIAHVPRTRPVAATTHAATGTYEAPIGATEVAIARLWAELFTRARVGREDHFFLLGGNSLLAVRLVERLRRAGMAAKLSSLFAAPVLSAFARTVVAEGAAPAEVQP